MNAARAKHSTSSVRWLLDRVGHDTGHAAGQARRARATRRDCERQLAPYVSPAEVQDMLATLRHQDGPEADLMRDVLFSKS
jgi:hypothetical protein